MQESMLIGAPSAPASGATAVLFNSETMLTLGQLRLWNWTMLEIVYLRLAYASAASGLKAYAKYRSLSTETWRQLTMPIAVVTAVPAITETAQLPVTIAALAGSDNHKLSFDISPFAEFKVEHTNSANTFGAGEWEPTITLLRDAGAVAK